MVWFDTNSNSLVCTFIYLSHMSVALSRHKSSTFKTLIIYCPVSLVMLIRNGLRDVLLRSGNVQELWDTQFHHAGTSINSSTRDRFPNEGVYKQDV